jgi:GT2 family glycosyltransferase
MSEIAVIVPNWNGADSLKACLDSLLNQSLPANVIVVDNGSTDDSMELLDQYSGVEVIRHAKNKGYAGGVNPGFKLAVERGYKYAAPFNNDAVADKDWLKHLAEELDEHEEAGIATCKLLNADGSTIDSTGDYYTVWGLPYPRGRGEAQTNKYDEHRDVFGASGGASLYRLKMLEEVGLFDEDFFAYYEDVDLSFRAQLAGWKVRYVPSAIAYHQIGATSGKIKGFTTYQTLKNIPWIVWKDVPTRHFIKVWPRMVLAFWLFAGRALLRGQVIAVVKGILVSAALWPKKLVERLKIQKARKVSDDYIWAILVADLPPNARALRKLRSGWWKLRGKHV